MASEELLRVELAFEAPGQRTTQLVIDWTSGSVSGQVRTQVPGCDQAWNNACWATRPVSGRLSNDQLVTLLQTLASVPLADTPRHAFPGAAHYSVALVRRDSVGYGMARVGEGAAASAIEQALGLALASAP